MGVTVGVIIPAIINAHMMKLQRKPQAVQRRMSGFIAASMPDVAGLTSGIAMSRVSQSMAPQARAVRMTSAAMTVWRSRRRAVLNCAAVMWKSCIGDYGAKTMDKAVEI